MIGSGPNGLAAAVSIAEAGYSVLVVEAADEIGGGARTLPLTLPGFRHDVCSAIHPMAVTSPVFRRWPLRDHGLHWIHPDAPLAHPLDGGRAVILERSLDETARGLGSDGDAYRRLFGPAVEEWDHLTAFLTGSIWLPRRPVGLLRFAWNALRPGAGVARNFRGTAARALFAGLAGHSNLPLEESPSAGFGMALGVAAHAAGWPFPRGGAGAIAQSLASYAQSRGVVFETGVRVNSLDELEPFRIVLADISPRELLRISGGRFPGWYGEKLRQFQYGPAAFKLDWALDGPIPWSAPECARAGTVHLGGTAEEIAASEREVGLGRCPDWPMVLAAQHTRFDDSRAPSGKHTAWAYCHVPNGAREDMTARIENQMERFAPGFRSRILARSVMGPAAFEARNPNLVGGDFCGGSNRWRQILARPTLAGCRTPDARVLLCSSATPPGAGVHGICGFLAARVALRRLRAAQ